MNKIRIRKNIGCNIETIAVALDVKPIELVHIILESWVIDRKLNELLEKN